MGLVGPTAQPSLALGTLRRLQTEFADNEGAYIKSRFQRKMRITILILGAIPIALCLLISLFSPRIAQIASETDLLSSNELPRKISYAANFGLVWGGAAIGVWLLSIMRIMKLDFHNFHNVEEEQIDSYTRVIFICLSTMIFSFLIYKQFVTVSIGGIALTDFYSSPVTSFLFGALCGASGRALPSRLHREAERLVKEKEAKD